MEKKLSKIVSISVVYPAYNEEKNIHGTIISTLDALRGQFNEFEILIVNDGSTDQTGIIAEDLCKIHPEIRVIHNLNNMGIAKTVWRGLKEARYGLVIHNGMDYCFDLEDLVKMTPLLNDADIVVAARKGRPGYTLFRKIASVVNSILLRLLFGLKFRDYNFVQLYRKDVLDQVQVDSRNAAFLIPELLIKAHDIGYKIKEVDLEYHPRKHGKAMVGNPRLILGALSNIFKFWFKRLIGNDRIKCENQTSVTGYNAKSP